MPIFKHHILFYFLCFLLLFLGVNALMGGLLLMMKPDGSLMGMTLDWLKDAPFKNYFIPGLILFTTLGLFSLFTLAGLVFKMENKWYAILNIYPDRFWAWTYSIYVGLIAIIWITIQLIMTQYFWIQPVIIFNGVMILICALHPAVMNRFLQ